MNIKRILFPTDLSPCSLVALDYASEFAANFGAELHILYVDDLKDLVAMAVYSTPSFVASCARVELKQRLEEIRPALSQDHWQYHYVEGTPADEICNLAKTENVDLIIMSSHGRAGLSRVFLGSVAELVLRKSQCPVLVVKQPVEVGPDDETKITATGAIEAKTTGMAAKT